MRPRKGGKGLWTRQHFFDANFDRTTRDQFDWSKEVVECKKWLLGRCILDSELFGDELVPSVTWTVGKILARPLKGGHTQGP